MSSKDAQSNVITTYAQLALGMTTFGSATPISKIVTQAMPVFVGSLLRVGLGALTLLPIALRNSSEIRGIDRRGWLFVALIALFGMFGFTAFMLYGMQMVSGVVGAIVMSTAPAVTATASMLFMGDRPTWRKLVAIVLAVVGVLVLHLGRVDTKSDTGGNLILGSTMVFCAVCCEAAYTLLGKKISESVNPVVAAFLASALSLPLFLPLAIWQWGDFAGRAVSPQTWMALIWYGAGTLSLGTWLWYSGVRRASGTVAAGFMGLMPVSALVLSYVLLAEPFELMHLVGFLIVFSGVVLISWEHARMKPAS